MSKEILEILDKKVPLIDRVHGENHPELHKVKELYEMIKDNPSKELFEELRRVTSNYEVPSDGCPTYELTYKLLKELDDNFE